MEKKTGSEDRFLITRRGMFAVSLVIVALVSFCLGILFQLYVLKGAPHPPEREQGVPFAPTSPSPTSLTKAIRL
jgi:hypothetical protein